MKVLILTLLFLTFSQVKALADEIPRIYRSPYFLGRGDTGISEADYEDAIFYNPAGLAQGKGLYKLGVIVSPMISSSSNTKDLLRETTVENKSDVNTLKRHIGRPQHFGVQNFSGLIMRRAALGAFFSSNFNAVIAKSAEQGGLEYISADADGTAGLTFSLAESFFDDSFFIGATYKYLVARGDYRTTVNLAEYNAFDSSDQKNLFSQGSGQGIDLGFLWRGKSRLRPGIGLTVENVGDTKINAKIDEVNPIPMKQTINLGFSIAPGTRASHFKILADFRDLAGNYENDFARKTFIGTELTLLGVVGFTGGLHQGYPSGGFYVDTRVFRFDFGAYTQERGDFVGHRPDQRFYMRFLLGI